MGRADNDNAGPSGGSGGGRGGSSGGSSGSGGGGTGGGFGRDTPGHPGASDGKRGSSMGPGGGTAPDGGRGNNTPGHPDNPGRRGNNAPTGPSRDTPGAPDTPGRRGAGKGTAGSPAARARDAMSRRSTSVTGIKGGLMGEDANTAPPDFGVGEGYSHSDAMVDRAATGAVAPREHDMARGYAAGKKQAMAEQTVGTLAGKTAQVAAGVPGVAGMTKSAVGAVAGAVTDTPETSYGKAVGQRQASNTAAQSAAQAVAAFAGGPVAGMGVGLANAAINDQRTQDISRMSTALGFDSPAAPSVSGAQRPDGGGLVASAQAPGPAMNTPAPAAPTLGYAGSIDMDAYGRGLLSVAQTI